jgi:hypothetical protein
MRNFRRCSIITAAVVAAFALPAAAQFAAPADPGFAALEAQQSAANAKLGPRIVPGRSIPVPGTVVRSPRRRSPCRIGHRPGTRTRKAWRNGKR